DPEAQVVLPTIESDLAPLLSALACGGNLAELVPAGQLRIRRDPHVGVVLASRGYPEKPETGKVITGLDAASTLDDVLIFHAGTTRVGDDIVSNGGRVLTVVGRGGTYETAIARAYAAVERIAFDGVHVRRDIGQKALKT